jgi:hypothetical protein
MGYWDGTGIFHRSGVRIGMEMEALCYGEERLGDGDGDGDSNQGIT